MLALLGEERPGDEAARGGVEDEVDLDPAVELDRGVRVAAVQALPPHHRQPRLHHRRELAQEVALRRRDLCENRF